MSELEKSSGSVSSAESSEGSSASSASSYFSSLSSSSYAPGDSSSESSYDPPVPVSSSSSASSNDDCPGNLFSLTVSLTWVGAWDWDLHLKTPSGAHIYYGALSGDGFELNHDAHPSCADDPFPPETIEGVGACYGEYLAYKNLFSNCNSPGDATFTGSITVMAPDGLMVDGVFRAAGAVVGITNDFPFLIERP
jgi:hypothetical protein